MQTAVCLLPVIPMRKEPSHRSEMVSQLLFGEYVTAGKEADDFTLVRCEYDGYEGWVQTKQLTMIDAAAVLQPEAYTASFATPITKNDEMFYVPYAVPVFAKNGNSFSMAGLPFTYVMHPQQMWRPKDLRFSVETLSAVCQPYMGAPYLWGGKSAWGTDCSGFVQQVFKLFGIKLLRDACLQMEQGTAVPSLPEAQVGDLAFFQNDHGRVTHVGIVLENGKIIHASGEVRIDKLDERGIIHFQTGERTHTLHSIHRFAFGSINTN